MESATILQSVCESGVCGGVFEKDGSDRRGIAELVYVD